MSNSSSSVGRSNITHLQIIRLLFQGKRESVTCVYAQCNWTNIKLVVVKWWCILLGRQSVGPLFDGSVSHFLVEIIPLPSSSFTNQSERKWHQMYTATTHSNAECHQLTHPPIDLSSISCIPPPPGHPNSPLPSNVKYRHFNHDTTIQRQKRI